MKTSAIVAHYSNNSTFSASFQSIIRILLQRCERIIVITTAHNSPPNPWSSAKVKIIQRPNIGYDFFSYRVGLQAIIDNDFDADHIIITNSSYVLSNENKFLQTLDQVILKTETHGIVGLTSSLQFHPHIQSYFLSISNKILHSSWFINWMTQIWPTDSKIELIFRYEIPFLTLAQSNGTVPHLIYQASPISDFFSRLRNVFLDIKKNPLQFWRSFPYHINPTLAQAIELSKKTGVVKIECLRENPMGIKIHRLFDTFGSKERAEALVSIAQSTNPKSAGTEKFLHELAFDQILEIKKSGNRSSIAVVLHAYYPDLIDEIIFALKNIPQSFDLFITTPRESIIKDIIAATRTINGNVSIMLFKNFGRDVAPFFTLLRSQRLAPYAHVLKLHTKKSLYSDKGGEWRQRLLHQLLPSPARVDAILHALDHGIGLIGPRSDFLTHERFWGANRTRLMAIAQAFGYSPAQVQLGFFAGTMFWFNQRLMAPIYEKLLTSTFEFEEEKGQQDGTLAHALERAIPELARLSGLRVFACSAYGSLEPESAYGPDSIFRSVPVLGMQ